MFNITFLFGLNVLTLFVTLYHLWVSLSVVCDGISVLLFYFILCFAGECWHPNLYEKGMNCSMVLCSCNFIFFFSVYVQAQSIIWNVNLFLRTFSVFYLVDVGCNSFTRWKFSIFFCIFPTLPIQYAFVFMVNLGFLWLPLFYAI